MRRPASTLAAEGVGHATDLMRGLAEADIVSVHAPKTPETTHIIDADALRAMRSDAFQATPPGSAAGGRMRVRSLARLMSPKLAV